MILVALGEVVELLRECRNELKQCDRSWLGESIGKRGQLSLCLN